MNGKLNKLHKLKKLPAFYDLARQYSAGSGILTVKTLARMLYAHWRYHLQAEYFGLFGLMGRPVSSLKGRMTSREIHDLLAAIAPQQWRFLDEDKLAFLQRCREWNLPACPILGVITEAESEMSRAESMGIPVARSASETERLLAQIGDLDGILKRTCGGKGIGIYPIAVRDGIVCPRPEYQNAEQLFSWLRSMAYDFSWLIQPKLQPHPDLLALMPGPGLGTVRIISFRKNSSGQVTLVWPIMKVPSSGSITDNWRVGQGGGLIVMVDAETGTLGPAVGKHRDELPMMRLESHPISGARITGLRLPHWDDLCRLVRSAASAFKELPALGWDVAITPEGPVFIETNWDFGLYLVMEPLLGCKMRAELVSLIEEISS